MATRIYNQTKSRLAPKKVVNAVWYDRVTSTPQSSALLIQSDTVASMYKFLETPTEGFSELLKALFAAKYSPLKFERICTDESIIADSDEYKMTIAFLEQKQKIFVTVKIHSFYDNKYFLKDDSVGIPIKFRHWKKIIQKLEQEYEQL